MLAHIWGQRRQVEVNVTTSSPLMNFANAMPRRSGSADSHRASGPKLLGEIATRNMTLSMHQKPGSIGSRRRPLRLSVGGLCRIGSPVCGSDHISPVSQSEFAKGWFVSEEISEIPGIYGNHDQKQCLSQFRARFLRKTEPVNRSGAASLRGSIQASVNGGLS